MRVTSPPTPPQAKPPPLLTAASVSVRTRAHGCPRLRSLRRFVILYLQCAVSYGGCDVPSGFARLARDCLQHFRCNGGMGGSASANKPQLPRSIRLSDASLLIGWFAPLCVRCMPPPPPATTLPGVLNAEALRRKPEGDDLTLRPMPRILIGDKRKGGRAFGPSALFLPPRFTQLYPVLTERRIA